MIDRERDLLKEFSQMQIPGHSCPYINEAIQRVSDAEIDARFALRQGRGYESAIRDIIKNLSEVESLLENLREQNADLRLIAELGKRVCGMEPYEDVPCRKSTAA